MKNSNPDIVKLDLEYKIRYYRRFYILGTILLIICLISIFALMIRQSQLNQEHEQYREVEITSQNNGEAVFQRIDEISNELGLINTISQLLLLLIIVFAVITPVSYSKMQTFLILLKEHLKSQPDIPSN
jgi:hypothetical protein